MLYCSGGYRRFVAPHENFAHPTANETKAIAYDPTWNYELVYSLQVGAEIYNPEYGARPEQYAPWNAATAVILWPSVFDTRGVVAGPGQKSTSNMQHFVNFVLGANGVRRLVETGPPSPEFR